MSDRMKNLLCLLLIPLPLFVPYLWLDHLYFWANPDSIFYINVYTSYRDALWQGEFFPHWIANTNVGLGSVVFYNVSPLVFYITAIINAPFSFSDEHQYLLGIYISQVFGAWAMWRWMRTHYESRIALLAALLFTILPYKWIDLYQHFTLGQCWAIAFLPLWFQSAETLKTRGGMVQYGFAAALTFYAHALTVISVGPCVVAYALHRVQWQWKTLLKPLVIANLLAFALIASLLAAMFTASSWLQLQRWSDANFSPVNNLYHVDDFIGFYAILFMWLVYRTRGQLVPLARSGSPRFWSVVLVVLYVIATPLSYPLWANVSAMNIFQFPFPRLQPSMAIITTLFCTYLLAGKRKEYDVAVFAVYAMFITLCLVHIQMVYHRPQKVSMLVHELAAQYHVIPGPIHLPLWTPITPDDLLLGHEKFKALPLFRVKEGEAASDKTSMRDGIITAHVSVTSKDALLVVSQFYIPAWKAFSDNTEVEVKPYTDGMVSLNLPQGEHDLVLRVTKSLLERAADALSLLSLGLVLIHAAIGFKKPRKA